MKRFPLYQQLGAMDCGPTCLRMIAKYYGKHYSLDTLRQRSFISRNGVSMLGISTAAESIGFRTLAVHVTFEKLCEAPLPCIVHWNQNHFVVVYDIKPNKRHPSKGVVLVADPAGGNIKYSVQEFLSNWISTVNNGKEEGMALLLETTPDFYTADDEKNDKTKLTFIFQYFHKIILLEVDTT